MNSTDKLHATLADLRRELQEVSPGDPEVREMLAQTLHAIADKLHAHEAGLAVPGGDDVGEQLRAVARRFEADHPAMATTLEGLVDTLARMGI